jgi:hypothetical protein
MTNKTESIAVLDKLRSEVEELRRWASLAKKSDYNDGYLKALTNVFGIIDEQKRIIKQDGDPTILISKDEQTLEKG